MPSSKYGDHATWYTLGKVNVKMKIVLDIIFHVIIRIFKNSHTNCFVFFLTGTPTYCDLCPKPLNYRREQQESETTEVISFLIFHKFVLAA